MVTGGGLNVTSRTWVDRAYYDRDALMDAWRRGVIALIHAVLRAGKLRTELTAWRAWYMWDRARILQEDLWVVGCLNNPLPIFDA
jgi:hypothetical protein